MSPDSRDLHVEPVVPAIGVENQLQDTLGVADHMILRAQVHEEVLQLQSSQISINNRLFKSDTPQICFWAQPGNLDECVHVY